jgi:hypothetical protein
MKDDYNTQEFTSDLAVWQGYDQPCLHLVNEESIRGSCQCRPPHHALLQVSLVQSLRMNPLPTVISSATRAPSTDIV